MKFRDTILTCNIDVGHIPSGYKRIADIILLRSNKRLTRELGELIIQCYPWCKTVFQYLTTLDENRRPEIVHLAGENSTFVTHKENGVYYRFDISKVMFAGGNSQLRRDLVNIVDDKENLLDMFAAVGNLSMGVVVKKNINAILIEKDPITYKYLLQTLDVNGISTVKTLNIDCRNHSIVNWADRIFLGYHNVDQTHLEAAIKAAKSKSTLHLHPIARIKQEKEWIDRYQHWFDQLGVKSILIDNKKIKDYSPNLIHIQLVYSIEK